MNIKHNEDNVVELFTNKEIISYTTIFITFWVIISITFKILGSIVKVGVATLFPVGKCKLIIPSILGILIGISIFFGFLIFLRLNSKYEFNFIQIVIIGILLIIGTSLINGLWKGLISPTESTGGLVFYWDAIEIENAYEFIRNYEQRQHKLELHSRTHPPGAVLLYYVLYKLFFFSGLISIAICIISSFFSAYFLHGILKRELNLKVSLYTIFLFLLLPAIQIYYLANLYAIVTTLIIAIIFFYRHPNYKVNLFGTIVCIFLTAFLTFMVVFIIAVLFCFEFIKSYETKRIHNLQKLYIITLSLFVIYVIFLIFFNFNYVNSFLYASREENPHGFMLIYNPYEYFITRVEDILEIAIFFGPFLIVLFYRGFPIMRKDYHDFFLLTISALTILLLLFLVGVYKTGETARACSYIYVFLIIPIAIYLNESEFSLKEKNKLLILVFIQTIIMQTMGYYKW